MKKFELIAPCHFGMEAVLKREILDLGYEIVKEKRYKTNQHLFLKKGGER